MYDGYMTLSGIFHHLFIPYPSNNHRPKVLHIDALLCYIFLFALFNFTIKIVHKEMPDVLGYATDIHLEQLLGATNAKRQEQGLSKLTLNSKLSAAAAAKAQDMFGKNYWAHTSPTGNTPWDFIQNAGYHYTVAGENLAKNFTSSQAVVEAWMASPTHRDNIVKSSYREVGFAIVNGMLNGEETTLVVQMFGSSSEPKLAAVVTQAPQIVREALAIEVEPTTEPVATVSDVVPSTFLGVTKDPVIHIPTLTREIAYLFFGIVLSVLALDAWLVSRKRIVRVAGHNMAHFLFLSMIAVAVASISRGSLL